MAIANPHHYFYSCNGAILRSMDDLLDYLKVVDGGTFGYHVNSEKNDYANWVRDILKDKALSDKMFRVKSRKEMLRLVYDKCKTKKKNKNAIISKIKSAIKHG